MPPVLERVYHGEDNTHHGDKRPDLNHGPRRPVQRHEILAVTELQRQQGIRLHDDNGRGYHDAQ